MMQFSINATFKDVPKGVVRNILLGGCQEYYTKYLDPMDDGEEYEQLFGEFLEVFSEISNALADDSMYISEEGVMPKWM